jgi:predicted DNA binding CopG/RHH family protein
MKTKDIILDNEELQLLDEIESGEWREVELSKKDIDNYKQSAKYTKSLQEKKQTTIRFSVSDLATVKAKAKDLGIGYQNLIQALVHNYAIGKVKLEA